MKMITCQVAALTPLTAHVYKALLKPSQAVDFAAGQYLNFVMSDEDKRPFSIASAPGAEYIELQIGAFGSDSYPMQVIEHIKANAEVTIEMPFGSAQLREDSQRPLLLIAGGTGFSYIKSMFEHLVAQSSQREVIVYWGLRDPSDNLADYDIYLAGRFEMVAAVREDFVAQGALVEHMYADAFAFI